MKHPAQERRRKDGGFTLIELLVAIAILGILGTVAIKEIWGYIDEAKQTATKAKLDNIETQVQMYKRKHNEVPRDLETLLEPDPRNRNRPYLAREDILDAWGNPCVIIQDSDDLGGVFEVVSYGENGEEDDFSPDYGLDMDISSKRPLFAENE